MKRLGYGAYTLGLAAFLAAYAPIAMWRRVTRGVDVHLRERLGFYRGSPPDRGAAWVHAVSVGETIAAVPIVEELRRAHPELPIILTTVTETGAQVARGRLDGIATHRYFPLDLPGPLRRALAANRPRLFIALETEIWPNLLRAFAARGVPVMIANGRISDRSFRRYRRIRPFMRGVLETVAVFSMRSDEDAQRIIALGAPPERVFVSGDLKNEVPVDEPDGVAMWRRLLGLPAGAPVWVAGSTHRGEDEIIAEVQSRLGAVFPGLVLIVAPRHPERVEDVERVLRAYGLPPVRRSALRNAGWEGRVVVLDTVGELARLYQVADAVFVGGSLVPAGGHNVLEAARQCKPVLFGPYTENFREAADLLVGAGAAFRVPDAEGLAQRLGCLLTDPALRTKMGEAGYTAVSARQGAVRGTLDLVDRFLYREDATGG